MVGHLEKMILSLIPENKPYQTTERGRWVTFDPNSPSPKRIVAVLMAFQLDRRLTWHALLYVLSKAGILILKTRHVLATH
jgi:hypothetical protein